VRRRKKMAVCPSGARSVRYVGMTGDNEHIFHAKADAPPYAKARYLDRYEEVIAFLRRVGVEDLTSLRLEAQALLHEILCPE
jgi:hypothetical protein